MEDSANLSGNEMDLKEIAGGLQLGFIWHSIGYAV
jgi:hypothetical protein